MDCAQFDEILHDLDRPGTKGAVARELAMAHAESCHRCAELLTQSEWLDFNLLRLKEEVHPAEAPARVESALLQEFRRTVQASNRRKAVRRAAVIGIAAALFLALGLSLRHRIPAPAIATPSAGLTRAPEAHPSVVSAPARTAAPAQAASSPQLRENSEAEPALYATNFMPLPYADDSLDEEDGTIVRVRISRAALASLGLPVIEGDGAERLQADLLLSADGTPQAIRLLSEAEFAGEF
ncbi:MAG TPA: hypothetical protein VEG64_12480 [Candidatus Sulfotelmatobacter sp.]|nr:hypothetical protein [Candidatus Sulfotelmatobacter sp.]